MFSVAAIHTYRALLETPAAPDFSPSTSLYLKVIWRQLQLAVD